MAAPTETLAAPNATAVSTDIVTRAARAIIDTGYAVVKLSELDETRLNTALSTAVDFFRRPAEFKGAHASEDFNYGYRPFGVEYSVTPDRPDVNECFTLWADRLDKIPDAQGIAPLTDSFLGWRDALAPLVKAVLDEVARHYGVDAAPRFENASYLQINYYLQSTSEREFLQDRHEDGHMVTVIHPTKPGLEIYVNGEPQPALPAEDEVIIMPGSVLTLLSGGKVPPLYHQVRNLGLDDRQAIMYFVNPELDEPLYGWFDAGKENPEDIREHVRNAPKMFGLPEVESL